MESRQISFIVFIVIFSTIYFLMHFFVYKQVVEGVALSEGIRRILAISFLVLGISYFAGVFLARKYSFFPLMHAGSIWIGCVSISLSVFLLLLPLRLYFSGHRAIFTIAGISISFIFIIISLYIGNSTQRIKEIDIKTAKIPGNLASFSIVHLSDLHIGDPTSYRDLKRIVEMVNGLDPDLVLITGDMIDYDVSRQEKYVSLLSGLKSKYGTIAVTGNHEFYVGIENIVKLCNKTGIRLLRNEVVTIEGRIDIIGIDDFEAIRFEGKRLDLEGLLASCSPDNYKILLSHRPEIFKKASKLGIDLQLSGHTHAGQIPPMDLIVRFYYRHPWGLYREGESLIYTTSGTSEWGPPMRLTSFAEIVNFKLNGN